MGCVQHCSTGCVSLLRVKQRRWPTTHLESSLQRAFVREACLQGGTSAPCAGGGGMAERMEGPQPAECSLGVVQFVNKLYGIWKAFNPRQIALHQRLSAAATPRLRPAQLAAAMQFCPVGGPACVLTATQPRQTTPSASPAAVGATCLYAEISCTPGWAPGRAFSAAISPDSVQHAAPSSRWGTGCNADAAM